MIVGMGAAPLVTGALTSTASHGIVCLTSVSSPGRKVSFDAGGANRDTVLENDVVFGSVNATLHHYRLAAQALAAVDRHWLRRPVSCRVPLERFEKAFQAHPDDVRVVLELQGAGGAA